MHLISNLLMIKNLNKSYKNTKKPNSSVIESPPMQKLEFYNSDLIKLENNLENIFQLIKTEQNEQKVNSPILLTKSRLNRPTKGMKSPHTMMKITRNINSVKRLNLGSAFSEVKNFTLDSEDTQSKASSILNKLKANLK